MPCRTAAWHTYHRATRSATYGFLSALPLFVLYETTIVLVNLDATRPVRVEAGVWIKELLMMTGASGGLGLALLVAGGGLAAYLLDRDRDIPLRSRYFVGLVGESAAYAVGVALVVSSAVGALFAAIPPADGALWTQLALSIGAGLYEELVFRVLLVGGWPPSWGRSWNRPPRPTSSRPGSGPRCLASPTTSGPWATHLRCRRLPFGSSSAWPSTPSSSPAASALPPGPTRSTT